MIFLFYFTRQFVVVDVFVKYFVSHAATTKTSKMEHQVRTDIDRLVA